MMTGFRLNFSPLKEPLGFVKLVEWVSSMRAYLASVCESNPEGREDWTSLFCAVSPRRLSFFAVGSEIKSLRSSVLG